MKTDKPFRKSFALAAILFAIITTVLVATGAENLGYRIGYVLSTCFFPGLATGAWGFLSKKSWSWSRFAITIVILYLVFGFIMLSKQK
jgi:hypothetical protein